jgi:site-specific DNA-methyltransferase (adenine-specific)
MTNLKPVLDSLDPYMGSATMAMACIQQGRQFIGIDVNERFCQIAKERIQEALSQGNLGLE